MSNATAEKPKAGNKTTANGGKGSGAGTKPKTEPAPKGEDKPKRTQNRRTREYTVEKQVRMIPASSVDAANEAAAAAVQELMTKGGSPTAESIANAANQAANKVLRDDSSNVWIKAATVKDMSAGDKWIAANAEDNIPYRVSVVSEPVTFAVETKQVRVQKL